MWILLINSDILCSLLSHKINECVSARRMMSYRHHYNIAVLVCISRPYDVLPSSLYCACVSAGRMMSYRHHYIIILCVCISRPYDVLPSSLHYYIVRVYQQAVWCLTVIIASVHCECVSAGRMVSYRHHYISTLWVCISRPYDVLPSSLHQYIASVYEQAVWCLTVIIASVHCECVWAGRMMSYRHNYISTLWVCISRPYDVLPSSLYHYIVRCAWHMHPHGITIPPTHTCKRW